MTSTLTQPFEVIANLDDLTRAEWLDLRRSGIGGSDAAGAAGLSRWSSPLAVYLDKTGATTDDTDNARMAWGRRLEDVVAQAFSEETGLPVHRYPFMLRSTRWPWAIGDIDRLIGGATVEDAHAILEVKTAGRPDAWEDGVPTYVEIQTLHYLAITGLPKAYVVVLIGGQRLEWFEIDRDDDAIADLMDIEEALWHRITSGQAPAADAADGTTDALKRIRAREGETVDLPDDARRLLAERAWARQNSKAADEQLTAIDNQLKAFLGAAEIGLVDGEVAVTWKAATRRGIDTKRLEADHPDLVEQYRTTSAYRTLRPKEQKSK